MPALETLSIKCNSWEIPPNVHFSIVAPQGSEAPYPRLASLRCEVSAVWRDHECGLGIVHT